MLRNLDSIQEGLRVEGTELADKGYPVVEDKGAGGKGIKGIA